MKQAQEMFAKHNIPVTNYMAAIRYCNLREFDMETQLEVISTLVPTSHAHELDPIPLKFAFLYFVQDTVRALNESKPIDLLGVFESAVIKADALLVRSPEIYTK